MNSTYYQIAELKLHNKSLSTSKDETWIKAPLEKKLVIKLKPESRRKTLGEAEQRHHEVDDRKLITLEEENRRLVAELEKLKELVKMHDKSCSMVHVRGGF